MENKELNEIEKKMKLIRHNPLLVGEYLNLMKERSDIIKGISSNLSTTRRHRLDLITSGEQAIYNAVQEVEKMGGDVRLTDAIVSLGSARDSVADYIEGVNRCYSDNDKLRDIKTILEDNHPHEQMVGLIKNVLNTPIQRG